MPTLDFTTANAAVGGAVSRYFLRIDHYWDEDKINPNGQSLETPSFNAGDCYWCIYCDPKPDCIIDLYPDYRHVNLRCSRRQSRQAYQSTLCLQFA